MRIPPSLPWPARSVESAPEGAARPLPMIPARPPPPPHISLDLLLILSGDGSVHGQRRREEVGDGPLLQRVPVPQHLLLVISSSPTFATPRRSPVRGTGFHHARPLIGGCRTRRPRPGPLF